MIFMHYSMNVMVDEADGFSSSHRAIGIICKTRNLVGQHCTSKVKIVTLRFCIYLS